MKSKEDMPIQLVGIKQKNTDVCYLFLYIDSLWLRIDFTIIHINRITCYALHSRMRLLVSDNDNFSKIKFSDKQLLII